MTRRLSLGISFLLVILRPLSLYGQTLNIPGGGTVTLAGPATFTYSSVSVAAGATLVIGGQVFLNVTGNVDIEGTVDGQGLGYGSSFAPSPGPGAGQTGSLSERIGSINFYTAGGGGGHGGAGGGGTGYAGGSVYDSATNPVSMGSAGGSGGGAPGSAGAGGTGGAALVLSAPSGSVTLNGAIDMSGNSGSPGTNLVDFETGSGGGGAGGTISVDARGIYGSGTLLALGGWGGSHYGSGGGGGRIRLCASNGLVGFTGSASEAGGPGGFGSVVCPECVGCPCFTSYGPPGQPGTFYDCDPFNTPTPTPTIVPPTPSPTPSPTTTPVPSPACDKLGIAQNLFHPSAGPLSIQVDLCGSLDPYSLRIYNTAGELARTLNDKNSSGPASDSYAWDGKNKYGNPCASGVYIIYLEGPFAVKTARVLLIR